MPKLSTIRDQRAAEQGWRCHYCRQPMWQRELAAFATRHGLSLRRARWLQVTAEHLCPRSDGGDDDAGNVAAACLYCNLRRHASPNPLDPGAYGRKVRARLAAGRWHGILLSNDGLPDGPETYVGQAQPIEPCRARRASGGPREQRAPGKAAGGAACARP